MLEDFRLRVFVTVAQAGSFTMAAVQLGITQPAVSQHISELEKNYGVRLFDRLRGAIVLTPSGELFYEHAVEILQQYDHLHQMLQRLPERVVKVSASEDVFHYLVTVLLDKFQRVHPEVVFQHSFLQEADLRVSLEASPIEKGTIRLSYHPSSSFASTRLWSVLSKTLQPTLK